ncbi:MAG: hypothetical protein AAF840_11790, partial [Bacteroidota bacterium]
MHRFTLLLICLCASLTLTAQNDFQVKRQAENPTSIDPNALRFTAPTGPAIAPATHLSHLRPRLNPDRFQPIFRSKIAGVAVSKDADSGQVYALRGRPELLGPGRANKADAYAYLEAVAGELGIEDVDAELRITEEIIDDQGLHHLRLAQTYRGLSVYPADARLHGGVDGFNLYTGRLQPTPTSVTSILPTLSEEQARTQVQRKYEQQWQELTARQLAWISGPQLTAELLIFAPTGQTPKLAWHVNVRPNLREHTSLMLDAQTGTTLASYTHTCGLTDGHHLYTEGTPSKPSASGKYFAKPQVMDGPTTARVQDLYDQFITINTFEQNDTFLLVDGARDMARLENNRLTGLILTLDGLSSTPLRDGFDPVLPISLNNQNWTKTQASVHFNAGEAYQYFLDKH